MKKTAVALTAVLSLAAPSAQQADTVQGRPGSRPWDITADLGPTQKLAFDTSEGTWMNVDVSPDGTQIVFDLLGDIYTMPIGGSGPPPRAPLTNRPALGRP